METYSLGLAIGRSYNSFKAGELYIGEERDFIKEQLKCITIPVLFCQPIRFNPVYTSLYREHGEVRYTLRWYHPSRNEAIS